MRGAFDPYHKWLGIPATDQPPHHYRLLGIELFEEDLEVIETAVDQRMTHVRKFQSGPQSTAAQRILNELSAASLCLRNPAKKAAYDAQLREQLAPPPVAAPVAQPAASEPDLPELPFVAPVEQLPRAARLGGRKRKPMGDLARAVLSLVAFIVGMGGIIGYLKYGTPKPESQHEVVSRTRSEERPRRKPVRKDRLDGNQKSTDRRDNAVVRTVPAEKPGELKILEARWGTGDAWVDVTANMQARMRNRQYLGVLLPDSLGVADPARGRVKQLIVRYELGGKIETETFDEWRVIFLSANRPPVAPGGNLTLLEATYTDGNNWTDVLDRLKPLVKDDLLVVNPFQLLGDPWPGRRKWLIVRWLRNGELRRTEAFESELLCIDARPVVKLGAPINLLQKIDPHRDAIRGSWRLSGGRLEMAAIRDAHLEVPHPAPDEYELTAVVTCAVQRDCLILGLPVGDSIVAVYIDSGLQLSGMALLDDEWCGRNEAAKRGRFLREGNPNTIVCQVKRNSVKVSCNGTSVIDWAGDSRRLSVQPVWAVRDPRHFFLGTWETPWEISKLELAPIGKTPNSQGAPVPAASAPELAVDAGLKWLATHQNGDGSWSFRVGNDAIQVVDDRMGATGLALLAFLGAGHTHKEGGHTKAVRDGLAYIIGRMKVTASGGDMRGGTKQPGMYSHGICSMALSAAYALSKDPELKQPAQLAVDFIANAQRAGGGWRYEPGQPGDTSVFGWQIMALKSGKMAKLNIYPHTIVDASLFLDSVQFDGGAQYGYEKPGSGHATNAIGLLGRMYLGWTPRQPALVKGVESIAALGPNPANVYYTYFGTQVMSHWGGPEWRKWDNTMRKQILNAQETVGDAAGSWAPRNDSHGEQWGRLYMTCMSIMTLEVEFRRMPLYKREAITIEF